MGLFGPANFDTSLAVAGDMQYRKIQEGRAVLHRVMESTGHSIDDVINDPMAKFRVRYFYQVNRLVHRYLQAREQEEIQREQARRRIIRF